MSEIIIEPCAADRITAIDLCEEIATANESTGPVETYRLIELGAYGYRKSVTGSMIWFPAIFRAAIEWGANADWTDATSPKDAVQLWQAGEMQP